MSNETKFTPGPWTSNPAVSCLRGDLFYISQEDGAPYTENYSDVCQTHEGEDLYVQKANAHLIAAAPEMYEALRAMRDGEGLQPGQTIESILLKARGETNV